MFSRRRKLNQKRPLYRKGNRKGLSLRWMLIWIPAAILALLVVLELFLRLLFGAFGTPHFLLSEQERFPLPTTYQLQFLSNQKTISGLPQGGELKIQRSPIAGYELLPNQESQFWTINEQGWREQALISQDKPDNKMRIFIIGGSTAFGYQSESNQATIAQKLQQRLNQRVQQQQQKPEQFQPETLPYFQANRVEAMEKPPRIQEKNYEVINAAVPGYASGNQLSQLAVEILPYEPDLIIIMGGYQDLMLDSEQSYTDIPLIDNYLSHPFAHFRAYLGQPFHNVAKQLYLSRMVNAWKEPAVNTQNPLVLKTGDDSLTSLIPQNSSKGELQARVQRYRDNHLQMVRLAAGANVPVMSALQPEITARTQNISEKEQVILEELGDSYREPMEAAYREMAKANAELEQIFPENVTSVNLYPLYEDISNQAFLNPIHLTSQGNAIAAKHLYQQITEMPTMQITPKEPGENIN